MTWLQQGSFLGGLDVETVEEPCGCTENEGEFCPEGWRLFESAVESDYAAASAEFQEIYGRFAAHRRAAVQRREAMTEAWYSASGRQEEACP